MDAKALVARLRSATLDAYAQLKPETVADRESNEKIVSHLTAWFNSPDRSITEAAIVCCEKYLAAELDSVTPGNRGLGRLTECEPRFAAKHRTVFQLRNDAAGLLNSLFANHLFLGYFFVEYLVEAFNGCQMVRDISIVSSSDELFLQWVPMLYSPAGASSFDRGMEKQSGEAVYWQVKGLWMNATLTPIKSALRELGILLDDNDKLLLLRYFDSGLVLRLLESKPLSKAEWMDLTTGGAYSAARAGMLKSERSGCLVFIATAALLAAWASALFA